MSDELNIELHGFKFFIGKMNAREQLHLLRKISPAFQDVMSTNAAAAENSSGIENIFKGFLSYISTMEDAAADNLLDSMLVHVTFKKGDNMPYSNLLSQSKVIMVKELSVGDLMQLAGGVLRHNLADFFHDLQGDLLNRLPTT